MTVDSKRVVSALTDGLVALGFKAARNGILVRVDAPDVLAWIGLNRAKRSGGVEINPVVGVRNQRVERLVAELTREEYDEAVPPTAGANVGYLGPNKRYEAFVFDDSASFANLAAECISRIRDVGLSFVQANLQIAELVRTLRDSRNSIAEQAAYRLPVALMLAGDEAQARTAVQEKLGHMGNRVDPAARRYVEFAGRLLAKTRSTED